MYKQMNYEDVKKWADYKIKQKSFEIPNTLFVIDSNVDAVKELVLENCPDIGFMTPNEILTKQLLFSSLKLLLVLGVSVFVSLVGSSTSGLVMLLLQLHRHTIVIPNANKSFFISLLF